MLPRPPPALVPQPLRERLLQLRVVPLVLPVRALVADGGERRVVRDDAPRVLQRGAPPAEDVWPRLLPLAAELLLSQPVLVPPLVLVPTASQRPLHELVLGAARPRPLLLSQLH